MKIQETNDYFVVDKPYGLPTTYKNDQDAGDCLVKRVFELRPELSKVNGFKAREGGLLYRLDNDTTGIVVFAKTDQAFKRFITETAQGNVCKKYIAVVDSSDSLIKKSGLTTVPANQLSPTEVVGEYYPLDFVVNEKDIALTTEPYLKVDASIGHSKKSGKRMIPITDSVAKVRAKNINQAISFVREVKANVFEIIIQKGVRHQIRVHLASIGNPIVGDSLYNSSSSQDVTKQQMVLRCVNVYFR